MFAWLIPDPRTGKSALFIWVITVLSVMWKKIGSWTGYALELAVRFQDEWRYEKAFPLLQIMLFSRVPQNARDECWVLRVAPSNTSLAQVSQAGPKLGHTWVQSNWFLSIAFLCASSEEKRSSSVPAWQEQMELEWLTGRLSAGVPDAGASPWGEWGCCWAGIEGSSGTEPVLGLYFQGSVLLL